MRLPGFKLICLLLLGFLCVPGALQAQEPGKKRLAASWQFSSNNSLFALYHEMAHLLFHKLDLPVLGKEEDAADNMATWLLLNKRTEAADRALADAAEGWVLSGTAYDSGGAESDYADGYSLDKQRAYQIVCLMVGKDKTAYRPLANEYRLERDRQESCVWDYDTVNRAFRGLLNEHGKKKSRGTKVVVTYHPVGGRLKAAADAFKSSGVFEQVADELRKNYTLRGPVQFNAKRCGEANAFYDPETVEIIFCYELMADYMALFEANMPPPGKEKPAKF
ncbi:DUF4344 domain-containing metallopeptidase [Devosia sp. A449]